jgi:hypothetical protein
MPIHEWHQLEWDFPLSKFEDNSLWYETGAELTHDFEIKMKAGREFKENITDPFAGFFTIVYGGFGEHQTARSPIMTFDLAKIQDE